MGGGPHGVREAIQGTLREIPKPWSRPVRPLLRGPKLRRPRQAEGSVGRVGRHPCARWRWYRAQPEGQGDQFLAGVLAGGQKVRRVRRSAAETVAGAAHSRSHRQRLARDEVSHRPAAREAGRGHARQGQGEARPAASRRQAARHGSGQGQQGFWRGVKVAAGRTWQAGAG